MFQNYFLRKSFTFAPVLLAIRNSLLPAIAGGASLPPPLLLRRRRRPLSSSPPTMSSSNADPPSSMEKQFEWFREQLDESGGVRERIRSVAAEIESATRIINSSILLLHQSVPVPDVLNKTRDQIGVLKDLYGRLSGILRESPQQYYRFHCDWRTETQMAISLLAFLHWVETGNLFTHEEAQKMLGLDASEFHLDVEDYLVGICFMSNEMPRYVVNRATAGDYESPRKVANFLTELHAAFRMLNLRNDFLRKKFDGLKYDLRRVEEVHYDVKIRGLADGSSQELQNQADEQLSTKTVS